MQILQWLLKIAEQEPPRKESSSTPMTIKKQCDDDEAKMKDIVILISPNHRGRRKHVAQSKVSCENLILLRCFYQTLNLKGLGWQKKKKKTSENKVLPITSQSWSRNDNINQLSTDSDNKPNKKKAVSRMKELLKWATTAKVLNSKKGAKAAVEDDESPKISFRLDMEDYKVSKAYYTLRDDHEIRSDAGIGNWITTDSEFVVLEL